MIGALVGSVAFVEELRKVIPVCKSISGGDSMRWGNLETISAKLADPETHFEIRGYEVKFNGHNMNKVIGLALMNFVEGDYSTLGSTLGTGLADAAEVPHSLFLF